MLGRDLATLACVCVAGFLIAAHSLADLGAIRPVSIDQTDATNAIAVCPRDGADRQGGCPAKGRPATVGAASVRVSARARTRPDRAAPPAQTAPAHDAAVADAAMTDGTGSAPPHEQEIGMQSSPPVPEVLAAATQLSVKDPTQLSAKELTFKHGYALRQAALGRSVAPVAAPPGPKDKVAPSKSRKVKTAHARQRKRMFAMPADRWSYGRAAGYRQNGAFSSAEFRSDWFAHGGGEPFGARRGRSVGRGFY